MRYSDAFMKAHLLYSPELVCDNVDCYIMPHHDLRPMRVDDKPGIEFFRCPICGKIFHRPFTMEQDTQSTHRVTPPPSPPPKRPKPTKKEETIDLPNLFTV